MWNLSRASYYADWVTLPILILAALASSIAYHGLTAALIVSAVVAFGLWTLIEYAIHRFVFHRLYRREHWLHHARPAAYVGVPGWQTGIAALLGLGFAWSGLGLDAGSGFFVGLASGYFAYIVMHDYIHHGRRFYSDYMHRRFCRHMTHHRTGREVNFGVLTSFWDYAFGTHEPT